jgi:hypothetical protein
LSLGVAAHSGDVCARGLEELDGEAADAARGTRDEDSLALVNARVVVHGLQGGDPGDREGRRVLEGLAGRLVGEPIVVAGRHVRLGVSAP